MQRADTSGTIKNLDSSRYPQKPFEKIALALSGGGFRSAGYSLGVLTYLNRIKTDPDETTTLLQKVRYLSTTSGGTVTGAFYSYTDRSGISFTDFYIKLFAFLNGEDLLDKVLSILQTDKEWKDTEKRRNLINAFAKAYDSDSLFNDARFGCLFTPNNSGHIEEVCFNTTEFFTGITFRFQVHNQTDPVYAKPIGNAVVQIEKSTAAYETVKQLKMADILAASSCFPAGFEPIVYPNDFANNQISISRLKEAINIDAQSDDEPERAFVQRKEFGLMDGGITDNQGLNSLMDADLAKTEEDKFDLIIVNDVASHYMQHYKVPTIKQSDFFSSITPRTLITIICILLLAFTASVLAFSWSVLNKMLPTYFWYFVIPQLAVLFSLISLCLFIQKKLTFTEDKQKATLDDDTSEGSLNRGKNFTRQTAKKLYRYLKRVNIAISQQMLMSRVNSVLALNNDIFLKHIRRLIYDKFYTSNRWDYRRISNHIYELSYTNLKNRNSRMLQKRNAEDKLLSLSDFNQLATNDDIKRIAQNAFKVPTTLWFDDNGRENFTRESLITCGNFTICHNLLKYIMRLQNEKEEYEKLPDAEKKRLNFIRKQVEEDWRKFLNDPFWLFNEMGKHINGFTPLVASQIKNPKP